MNRHPANEPLDVDPDRVRLDATEGTSAEIEHHGAQVLSWICRGRERMFVSPHATFKAGKAIRGGVPIIFPQFADGGTGVRHGFARLMAWKQLSGRVSGIADNRKARFELKANEHTLQTWPYLFRAEVIVSLEPDEISIEVLIENLDQRDFAFTAALHTYLRVSNVGAVSLSGLEGRPYRDSANGGRQHIGSGVPLRFEGEIDRIYPGVSGDLFLRDGSDVLRIRSRGFSDTVVWNPGELLAAGMGDLGADQYPHFACVESGVIATPCVVSAGATWRAAQCLSIIS